MRRYVGISIVLLLTAVVYWPVLQSEYVAYDDELLLVDNVKAQGLTWEHVREAFTTYDPELYIPLTLLTEQIEYTVVGHWNSAVSHGINLVLHLLNVLLVYWLMTLLSIPSPSGGGLPARSERSDRSGGGRGGEKNSLVALFVAFLWALHPLNTEAVAWVAARKDLLSGFFFLVSLCTYLKWREDVTLSLCHSERSRGTTRLQAQASLGFDYAQPDTYYWFSVVSFLLGLLAKVSIAPLPLVLILLEWFLSPHPLPFKRISPFFLLSAMFIGIALLGKTAQVHALGVTVLAPFLAIPFYLQKLFVPTGLSILYPFTDELTLIHPRVLLGIVVVGAITGIVWWSLRWTRSVAVAFGTFLLLLAPSFLNVARRGDVGMVDLVIASDRYMYLASLPLIALASAALFVRGDRLYGGGNSLSPRERVRVRGILCGILGSIVLLFGFLTSRQVLVWHDSEALFRNVLTQHQASHIAANNLAGLLARRGKIREAMQLYQQSIHIRENPRALFNLGRLLLSEKRFAEAFPLFERYVKLKPRDAFGQMQLGGLYLMQNATKQARLHLQQAVARDPYLAEAHYLLGVAEERLGNRANARAEFEETLRLKPDHPYARGKLGQSPLPAPARRSFSEGGGEGVNVRKPSVGSGLRPRNGTCRRGGLA